MSKFIKRHRSQFGRVSVVMLTITGLVALFGLTFMFIGTANALELTNRSVTVGDSLHATNTDYVFVFTTAQTLTHDDTAATDDYSFKFTFPVDVGGDPFTIPGGLAIGDISVTCASCDGITVTPRTVILNSEGGAAADDSILLVVDTGTADADTTTPVGAVFTVTIGTGATQITNPANDAAGCTFSGTPGDADVCSITVDTTESFVNPITSVDVGDVLSAFVEDVTVSVTVDESLTFSISGVASGLCDGTYGALGGPATTTANAVDFGTVSTFNTFLHGCQDLAVVTNAANGYTITVETDTSLQSSGGVEIDSGTCTGASCSDTLEGAWGTNTDNGFAYSCSTLTNDDGGNACNLTTEITNYKRFPCTGAGVDCSPGAGGEAPHNVMIDTSTGDDSARIEYKLSVGNTQAAAVYSTQATLIATPTF